MKETASSRFCVMQGKRSPKCEFCSARRSSVCSFLDDSGLVRLQASSTTQLISKRQFLCYQGEESRSIFIVVDGLVRLYRILPDGRRQVTGFLGPGDLLGSLKRSRASHCTAQAVNDVIVCTFDRQTFLKIVHDYPDLALNLLITATDEIEAQHEHAVLLGCRDAREKLATLLLTLSRRWHSAAELPSDLRLDMSRRDIADYLGLSVETVSRTFTAFKAEGLIELPSNAVVRLRNVPVLYHVAGVEEIPARGVALGL